MLAEAASFACFALMQYRLLLCGGVDAPGLPLFKMAFASQALANSLPAGTAVSAVYGFRWFRRFGADDTVAVWAMVGTMTAAMIALSLVATAGLALATGEGASLDLIPVLLGVLVIALAVGALFVYEKPLFVVLTRSMRISQAIFRRPRGDAVAHVDRIMRRATSVHLQWREILTIVFWGTANWLFDCSCFAMMFLAIGSTIPWKGLLLAYGAGQLAAALPITPGGLGAVEGSITIALVAFGGAHLTTVDAVLLYRLISFWLVLVVGWLLWGELALEVRRGRWGREATAVPVRRTAIRPPSRGCHGARGRPAVGVRTVTPRRRATRFRLTGPAAALVSMAMAAALMAGCTTARNDLGTSDSSCYIALPAAARAVGSHGRLIGVHLSTLGALRRQTPGLFDALPDKHATSQRICTVAFMGSFTSTAVSKPAGRSSGTVAVVVSTFPSNALIGTVIADRPPPHVGHSHFG